MASRRPDYRTRWAELSLVISMSACSHLGSARTLPRPFCSPAAPGAEMQPTSWELPDRPDTAQHPASVLISRTLSGSWDMLTVMTEGADQAVPERWHLRLVSPDSATRNTCLLGPCRTPTRVVAVGAHLIGNTPFDSAVVSRATDDPMRIVARYDSVSGSLNFALGPPIFDAGTFYTVTRLSDTAMTGRWTDGSYALAQVRRGNVTTWEHVQGFFCARRTIPSRDHDQSPNER